MTSDADRPSIATPPPAVAEGMPLHKRIFYSGIVILVSGLIAAVLIYVLSAEDAAGRAAADIFNRQHYEFQIERVGGKMMVYLVRFNEWFFSLWQGRRLAFTVGVLSIAIALACFWMADLLSVPLPPDWDKDRKS